MTNDNAQLDHSARLNLTFTLTDEDRNIWGHEDRLFLLKKKGESMHTAAMKMMAYWMYFEEGLEIEGDVDGQTFRPDVVKVVENDRIERWIDCGNTNIRKLEKIVTKTKNRDTQFVIVKTDEATMRKYRREAVKKTPSENVTYVTFSGSFIDDFSGELNARHTVNIVISGTTIYLDCDGQNLTCDIMKFDGVS